MSFLEIIAASMGVCVWHARKNKFGFPTGIISSNICLHTYKIIYAESG